MPENNLFNDVSVSDAEPRAFGAPFDDQEADVILRSCDLFEFRTYKSALARASPFFRTMFSLPRDEHSSEGIDEQRDGLHVLPVSEDSKTLNILLSFLGSYTASRPESLKDAFAVLGAARKYDMESVLAILRDLYFKGEHSMINVETAFRAYGLACRYHLQEEALMAARYTLQKPMDLKAYGEDLLLVSGADLYALTQYRDRCKDAVSDVFRQISLGAALDLWVPDDEEGPPCFSLYTDHRPLWISKYFKGLGKDVKQDKIHLSPQAMNKWHFHSRLLRHAQAPALDGEPYELDQNCPYCLDLSNDAIRLEQFCQTVQGMIDTAIQGVALDHTF